MTENQKNAANECFKHDANLSSVYVTDDAQCFTEKQWAQLHANESKLNDRTILLVNRNFNDLEVVDKSGITVEGSEEASKELVAETSPEEKVAEESVAETPAEEKVAEEPVAETAAQLIDKKLNAMNKVELQARATELGFEFTEENTKADLIALIEGTNEKN